MFKVHVLVLIVQVKQEGNSNIDWIPHAMKPKSAHTRCVCVCVGGVGVGGGRQEPKSAQAWGDT